MSAALAGVLGLAEEQLELDTCARLLAQHLDAATRRFGAVALGVIDLPALGDETLVPAQLRVAAVLYWCRELERAGVLPFVEALASAIEHGEPLAIGEQALLRLRPFGRRGVERMLAPEREGAYARLFEREQAGFDFPAGMTALLKALEALGRAGPRESLLPLQVRVATVALELGRELSSRAVGMAAFVARDVIAQIRDALALLRDRELAAALGGGTPTQLIERHGLRVLGRQPRCQRHQLRAGDGRVVLSWIADAAADVHAAARALGPMHEVVLAAQRLQLIGEGV